MIVATPKHPHLTFGPFGRRGDMDKCWKLLKPVHVIWEDFDFTVPKGFLFDGGSLPRAFWWFIAPAGKGNLAFLSHDFVYREAEKTPVDSNGVGMSREQADEMMYDLLVYSGLSKWKAWTAWRGTRRGGWLSYKKKSGNIAGTKQRRKGDG